MSTKRKQAKDEKQLNYNEVVCKRNFQGQKKIIKGLGMLTLLRVKLV